MNIGDKLTTKKHAFIFHFHKGGGGAQLAKRGRPGLYTKRAGSWRRNKYIPAREGGESPRKSPHGGFFGKDLQCYGEHRFEPGELIGEIVGINDEFIDVIIESNNFNTDLEAPFRISMGIKLDEHTTDAFTTLQKSKLKAQKIK